MVQRSKDEEAVDRALERFARRAATRRATKKILRAQGALQKMVSKRAWMAFLRVEEVTGERQVEVLDAAIQIALRQGRRGSRRRPR